MVLFLKKIRQGLGYDEKVFGRQEVIEIDGKVLYLSPSQKSCRDQPSHRHDGTCTVSIFTSCPLECELRRWHRCELDLGRRI